MSLYQAQVITPDYFLSLNSAGETVAVVPVNTIATNTYVDNAIAALIGLAPSNLDTLQEIAADLALKQTKLLTGYVVGSNAAIVDTDNVLQGFGKAQAQITANATAIAAAVADIATINTTLGTVVYLSSSQSITGIKSFTQVIKADGGLDVTATGGSDVLNIGTSNADIINIGWSGAQVVFQGSVFRNQVTNVYVTDKLATYNAGGAAASGYSVGFEIEENAIITGYFATNGSRDGWDFKAPGITDYLTLSLIGISAHRTLTAPNQSGTIVVTTDLSSYLALTGGTMSGDILMGSHDIKNVGSIYDGSTIAAAISTRLLKDSSGNTIVNWQSRTNGLGIGTGAGFFGFFKTTNVSSGIATLEFPDGSGTIARVSDLVAYEPVLGTPASNGYALVSTTGGVRSWVAFPTSSPLTTKGDLYIYSTTNARLAAGTDGYVLFADSTQTTGLRWGAASSQWTTTGSDIYYATGGVMIGNASAPGAKLHIIETGTASPRGTILDQYSTGVNSSQANMRKARGAYGALTTIVTADIISNVNSWAYDGTNFNNCAAIRVTSVGTISAGVTPAKLELYTMNAAGALTLGFTLDQAQASLFVGSVTAPSFVINGGTGSISGLKSEDQIFIEGPANTSYTVVSKKVYSETITKLWGLKTSSGTCTISIQVNGTPVTFTGSVTTVAVTSSTQDIAIISGAATSPGDIITFVVSSGAAPANLACTIEFTR